MKYTEGEDVAVRGVLQLGTDDVDLNSTDLLADGQRPQDFVCFSHLRWHFVHQRPQHLMTRFAREYRLFFVEEPVGTDAAEPSMDVHDTDAGVKIVVPRIPQGMDAEIAQRGLLTRFFAETGIERPILWYYTPMSLSFSDCLPAAAVVYDCMDELSAFRGAPPQLIERERALLDRADLVFTGGYSLYEAKRDLHASVHAFPSSVDIAHFAQARGTIGEPEDQAALPRPRLGFFGVIDERFDIDLLAAIARLRPAWQFVMIGPVVKIDPATLPQAANIHYLGMRGYADLPRYLSGWDAALMPFAMNESTRFISPTKTPEFLASGRPVVSTPVRDVVRTYGNTGLVHIAATPEAFVAACERALAVDRTAPEWLATVDRVLGDMSWDSTWGRMKGLIECVI
jgi:UDP-galactopyranose mutase